MYKKIDVTEAIKGRRSIRKFINKPVPRDLIEQILAVTIQAPSGKNRQPWRFVVIEGTKKDELVDLLTKVITDLKGKGTDIGSLETTVSAIKQAPVIVFVFNAFAGSAVMEADRYKWMVDLQSIGGAIQTMLLAAQSFGLGTLWICDVFYADKEICAWLNRGDQLVAAVSLGYPDQSPHARPRKPLDEITEWIE